MATKQTFYVEVTDTFGGECNYCWVRRYAVLAATERGAMRVVGRHEGYALRSDGYHWRFNGACIAAYVVDDVLSDERVRFVKLNF